MKKILLLTGVACLLGTQANAIDMTPYVSAKLKYSMMEPEVDFDGGDKFDVDDKVIGGSLALGLSSKVTGGAIRAELEYNKNADAEKSHHMYNIDYDSGLYVEDDGVLKVKTQSLFLNGYFDIDTNTKFTPYVGVGIGYTRMKGEFKFLGEKADAHDDTFSWQMGFGCGYALNENVTAEIGYRYVDYGDFTDEGDKLESKAHEILAGIRYNF